MSTQRAVERRGEEGITSVGTNEDQGPPQDIQVPPLEEVAMRDQVLVVLPPMTDGDIRETFLNLS